MNRQSSGIRRLVESSGFQEAMFIVILLASALVGLETYEGLVARHWELFTFLNAVILFIFTLEIALRILAEGWRFFKDSWNVFDFVIVAILLLPLHAEFFAVFRLVRALRLLRVAKALRILRLVDLPQLQFVVKALLRSLSPIGSIALLLSLHFYVYAVIGTVLFHDIDPSRFGTLHISILTLFTVLTMEGWIHLMYGLPEIVAPSGHSVPLAVTAAFFISFIVIGTMIVMNLIIGAIVHSMDDIEEEEEELAMLRKRKNGSLTPHQEIAIIEKQLQESTVCLRLLKKSLVEKRK